MEAVACRKACTLKKSRLPSHKMMLDLCVSVEKFWIIAISCQLTHSNALKCKTKAIRNWSKFLVEFKVTNLQNTINLRKTRLSIKSLRLWQMLNNLMKTGKIVMLKWSIQTKRNPSDPHTKRKKSNLYRKWMSIISWILLKEIERKHIINRCNKMQKIECASFVIDKLQLRKKMQGKRQCCKVANVGIRFILIALKKMQLR